MPTFNVNGTTVELLPQDRNVFNWLATQVYRKLFAEGAPPLPGMLAMIALDAPRQQISLDDPRPQAVLWTLYQLGFDTITLDQSANQIRWEKGKHPDIGQRPVIEHFTEEGFKDGRALAAGLSVVLQRTVRINGAERTVRTVDFELLKAQAEEMKKRHTNPQADMALAAARYLAELVSSGATDSDLRLRAALELAADLGVRSITMDPVNQQVRIDAFNEVAAVAAAFFQNATAEQIPNAVKRVQMLNQAAAEAAKQLERNQPVKAGAGAQEEGTQAINLAFKRRRR